MNFGVEELVSSKSTSAPGYAYVPDTGANAIAAALLPTSRKRARGALTAGPVNPQETTAKQDAKIVRELAQLDRENHRDVTIPVPVRHRDNAGRVSHGKVTPAVRKILASQKTFANHLSDHEALLALAPSQPEHSIPSTPSLPRPTSTPALTKTAIAHFTSNGKRSHKKKIPDSAASATSAKRSHKKKDPNASNTSTPVRASASATPAPPPPIIEPTQVLILGPGTSKEPASHPGDTDPLLVSRVPGMPTQEELQRLLAMPPLSYNEARGPWTQDDRRRPVRTFCEVCGYWGRVKCTRCGGRVCALECLKTHQEECFNRYGA